ncbi:eCIS core domain-containing protein [Candidatus Uabimicrobium amorphum]|uniref:GTP pyrophosphokinase n=1 Tax=Uabimicrobium amorphum TaxID=2596890 RepID=A0A5S9F1N3_UABAM|nr:GTP pyrophosphokinase [Candidatus Uabimicrobium amorphum]
MFHIPKRKNAKQKVSQTKPQDKPNTVPVQPTIQRTEDLFSLTHTEVMQLQKAAGNKAVQQLVSSENKTGLPDNLKRGIERLSGMDMSDIKVKYNSPEPAKVNAHAYAQGTNIHVAPKQEKHLAHEAWHTVQQKQGRVRPTKSIGGVPVNDSKSLEREADVMGKRASVIGRLISQFKVKEPVSEQRSRLVPIQRYIVNDDDQVVKLFPSKEEKEEQKVLLEELNTKVRSKIAELEDFHPKHLDTLVWSAMLKVDENPDRKFTIKDIVSYIKHFGAEKKLKGTETEDQLETSDQKLDTDEIVGADVDPAALKHAKELTMIYAVAVEEAKRLGNLTNLLLMKGGEKAKVVVRKFPGVKSMDRAAFKAVIKKKGETKQIADILASSLVFDDVEDLKDALPGIRAYLDNNKDNVTLVNIKNRFTTPSPQGYRDILMNVKLASGHVGEIQLHISKMIAAKKKGHKLYEDERELSEEFENIDIPYLKKMFKDIDTFFKNQTRDKKATIKHINTIRKARGLPQSEKATKLENEVKAADATKLKQELIKDLQKQAHDEFYGPAWKEEQKDFDPEVFDEIIKEIGKFKKKGDKSQDIQKTYKNLFGKTELIKLHEVFFVMAYELVRGYERELGRDVIDNLAKYSKSMT